MLERSGEVEFGANVLPVFQCETCTMPWDLGGGEVEEAAYTFAVTADGQVFDPASDDLPDSLLP